MVRGAEWEHDAGVAALLPPAQEQPRPTARDFGWDIVESSARFTAACGRPHLPPLLHSKAGELRALPLMPPQRGGELGSTVTLDYLVARNQLAVPPDPAYGARPGNGEVSFTACGACVGTLRYRGKPCPMCTLRGVDTGKKLPRIPDAQLPFPYSVNQGKARKSWHQLKTGTRLAAMRPGQRKGKVVTASSAAAQPPARPARSGSGGASSAASSPAGPRQPSQQSALATPAGSEVGSAASRGSRRPAPKRQQQSALPPLQTVTSMRSSAPPLSSPAPRVPQPLGLGTPAREGSDVLQSFRPAPLSPQAAREGTDVLQASTHSPKSEQQKPAQEPPARVQQAYGSPGQGQGSARKLKTARVVAGAALQGQARKPAPAAAVQRVQPQEGASQEQVATPATQPQQPPPRQRQPAQGRSDRRGQKQRGKDRPRRGPTTGDPAQSRGASG